MLQNNKQEENTASGNQIYYGDSMVHNGEKVVFTKDIRDGVEPDHTIPTDMKEETEEIVETAEEKKARLKAEKEAKKLAEKEV